MNARSILGRLAEVSATFACFAFFNLVAQYFQIIEGVSILFPATAVAIIGCMMAGPWAALGVILGSVATPWTTTIDHRTLLLSAVVCAMEGLIPWAVFRLRKLSRDLRDMQSFVAFLIFGTIVNTGVSAVFGNLFVTPHFTWRGVFVWWISGFIAALLLATPAIAFGGALLARVRHSEDRPRTISNTLQIVSVVILLGFASSFAIRTYLLNHLEADRLAQQRTWAGAKERINRLHANFLSAANGSGTIRESARRTNEELLRELAAAPELRAELPALAEESRRWFAAGEGLPRLERRILGLRTIVDRADADAWTAFAATRQKIMFVSGLVDAIVFLILVLAAAILLDNVSRPFTQIRAAVRKMREGEPLDASRIDSQYVEIRALADTLEETSRELRRREEELRLQTEKALRASQHKSDFLAKMSHELRTPLNAIIGFSDLLTEQEDTITPAKRLNFLENVSNSAKHLLRLINDLLDIARIESGKLKLHLQDIDLRAAVANTVATTQPLFLRKQQRVDVVLPDEPMLARADGSRVEQIFLNLLSNANKFSPAGETVSIRGSAEPSMWRIEVTDRGIGISADDQSRIFDEFEQVHSRDLHSSGTGLGLALARRFAEAHGGDIAVESAPGTGAVFRVRLPRL